MYLQTADLKVVDKSQAEIEWDIWITQPFCTSLVFIILTSPAWRHKFPTKVFRWTWWGLLGAGLPWRRVWVLCFVLFGSQKPLLGLCKLLSWKVSPRSSLPQAAGWVEPCGPHCTEGSPVPWESLITKTHRTQPLPKGSRVAVKWKGLWVVRNTVAGEEERNNKHLYFWMGAAGLGGGGSPSVNRGAP